MRCTDKNYINRLKKGKEDALEFIVDKYLGLVKATIYKVLLPLEKDGIIDECINDVFFSVWNNSNKFTGEEVEFKKWIYKIAKFKAIDYYRREVKNFDVSLEDKDITANKFVEDEIINIENKNELIKLINTLEPLDRQIFVMKFSLGMRSDEIAKKFGMSRTAIDNRVYRGKKTLKKEAVKLNLEVM